MAGTGLVDIALTYSFIRRLTSDYKKWQAYKTGVIDDKGNILVEPKDRTTVQRKSFKLFDLLVLNLRKILEKLPGGHTKFATYTAALFLITEEEVTEENFKKFMLSEEVTNTIGSGHVALKQEPMKFANNAVFDVDFDKMWKSRFGKHPSHRYNKYIGEDELSDGIKDYCKKNPKESIILRDSKTGQMVFFKKK